MHLRPHGGSGRALHPTCQPGTAGCLPAPNQASIALRPFHCHSLPRMLQAPDWPEQYKPIDVIQHPGET